MFKRNRKFIEHSDEFEDLFFEIANFLVSLQKLDNNQDENLSMLVRSFGKIGDRIGAGVE
jgi:phosphomevalonate kinase